MPRAPLAVAAMLYAAAAAVASPAAAGIDEAERAALIEARQGDMLKLAIHPAPRPRLETGFETRTGAMKTVSDWRGKVVVLNFWATWCPPCKKEMPSLDALQGAMGGDGFEVIALSMDRASVEKIDAFFQSIDARNLDVYREPTLRIGAEGGVFGMPITLILDREGREVARLQGEADWNGTHARDMIARIIAALDDEGA